MINLLIANMGNFPKNSLRAFNYPALRKFCEIFACGVRKVETLR